MRTPFTNNFLDDQEKMHDFFIMDKEAFLASYSYLTEPEYDATANALENVLHLLLEASKKTKPVVTNEDKPEFIGQIIDTFEDFLDEKGIVIPNEERDFDEDLDAENSANIYGSDYDNIASSLIEIMERWHIIEKEK